MAFQRRKPAAIGVKARFPGFIEPALAASIAKVPGGARWIHEIKFDGYVASLAVVAVAIGSEANISSDQHMSGSTAGGTARWFEATGGQIQMRPVSTTFVDAVDATHAPD
jgi:hypothetical protein